MKSLIFTMKNTKSTKAYLIINIFNFVYFVLFVVYKNFGIMATSFFQVDPHLARGLNPSWE